MRTHDGLINELSRAVDMSEASNAAIDRVTQHRRRCHVCGGAREAAALCERGRELLASAEAAHQAWHAQMGVLKPLLEEGWQ